MVNDPFSSDKWMVLQWERNPETATQLIQQINRKMRIDIKVLGVFNRFNGLDIHQMCNYVKITCERYIHKAMSAHTWINNYPTPTKPTPLPSDSACIQSLEAAVPPKQSQLIIILSTCSAGGRDTRPITLPCPASRIRTS
jgi:hypothetical protein